MALANEEEAPENAPELCEFFEDYEKEGPNAILPPKSTPWRT